MLKKLLIEELESQSYEEIATAMFRTDPLVRERLFCKYMGFAHNNAGNGCDGVNWATKSFVEIKTQYYNPDAKKSKLRAKGIWGSPSINIYNSKYNLNEETYIVGFSEKSEMLFYIKFTFDKIADEYMRAIKDNRKGLTLSYNKFVQDEHTIFVCDGIENYEYCIEPGLFNLLTDVNNKNVFNSHSKSTSGKCLENKKPIKKSYTKSKDVSVLSDRILQSRIKLTSLGTAHSTKNIAEDLNISKTTLYRHMKKFPNL
jgi:hypothetical protein